MEHDIWVENEIRKIEKTRTGPRTLPCFKQAHDVCVTTMNQQLSSLAEKRLIQARLRGICTCPCHD